MGVKTLKGEIVSKAVTEYLTKGNNRLGKNWKAPLANEIYLANKSLYKGEKHIEIERIRLSIRYVTGANGDLTREHAEHAPQKYSKILIIDIETSPIQAYVWGFWEQNINQAQVIKDWFVITWSAKWLFEKKIYEGKLTPKEAKEGNDKRIIKSVWRMLNEADICITHNGDRFDFKKLNTRFLKYGMHPPMPFISIDTLKVNKKSFAHSSNKLEYINTSLELPRKMEHEGFLLWDLCCRGDAKALDRMSKYNTQDVIIQEAHYLRIRSWVKPHPNININITDEKVTRCPACGSDKLGAEKGKYATQTATYGVCRCKDCGSLSAGRVNQLSKKQAKYIRKSVSK